MGRHSGFIACYASLAKNDANFVLIPEVPFRLDGEHGLLALLRERLVRRNHAVIVVAEGAGQDLVRAGEPEYDKSGNIKLGDIGALSKEADRRVLRARADGDQSQVHRPQLYDSQRAGQSLTTPSIAFGSRTTRCMRRCAGGRRLLIGRWNTRFVHIPMKMAIAAAERQSIPTGTCG